MDTSFGGNAIYDLSLEQGYLSSAMYGSGPLCAGFGEYEANDLLLDPEPSVCNTINELSMETFGCAQYGEFINPDDFLNDVLKSEPESCDTSPSSRDTPSPSGSQQSCESLPSSGGFDGCHVVPMHLESPPISPEASISPTDTVSTTSTALGSLRRVKATPKSSMSNKTITKKTIVLSAKDYKALLANMKQQPSNNTILLKATPTNKLPIMPTANGFKATSFVTSKQDNPPVLPKPQTTTPSMNGTHKSKESPTITGDISSPSVSPLTVPMILASGVNISEQTIDEKLLKKHQRMIKNRQSAIMSRVKKKEYVTSLEDRIQALTNENEQLRVENANLLERLKVGCSCVAGSLLIGSSSAKHVTPTARKNVAIVLAMLFMVSLNFYPIGNLLMNNERVGFDDDTSHGESVHHSRGLLWINETTIPTGSERTSYHLNITALDELTKKDSAPLFPSIECPFYVNQTENIRLASELRRWIGENGYKNLTDGKGEADLSIDTFDKMFRLKDAIDSMYRQMKDISVQMKSFERRQKKVAALSEKQKLRKLKHTASGQREMTPYQGRLHKQHDLDLYYPSVNMKYAEFFEEIGRRDDTFYLVSFSEEHLLLPALAYNKTNRPRMSLMLPTVAAPGGTMGNGTNRTDKITLMQIDCEVMNTSVIQIREKMIPGDLRPHGGGETSKGRANAFGGDRNTTTTNPPTGPSNQTNDNANRRTDRKGRMVRDLRSNLSSTPARINRKEPAVHHQHAPSRPFFVERMNEHLKSEHHVN
ncbi:cyclic AMP-dependent transcription factor ATF-6 alpha [Anopheles ziemanni]|uniref:cyclic AMP-dependent transcription factor ATF-6 alpha n=1 Tax=Anopheles ziemanni TaxID=345580 RepID=UPI00265E9B27|nr:cyclic AMP-dependent transcription factor ATF-6 alpha [Anopheles ziemanni]